MEINKASHLLITFSYPGTSNPGVEIPKIVTNLKENAGFNPSEDCKIEVRMLTADARDAENYDLSSAILFAWLRDEGLDDYIVHDMDIFPSVIYASKASYAFIQSLWAVPRSGKVLAHLSKSSDDSKTAKKWWEFWKK